MNSPITVDLNGSLAIRARAGGEGPQSTTELILSNSTRTGDPLRFNTNRQYLDRALRLGFREFWLCGADVAACGRDAHRAYVWAVLSQDGAVPHDDSTTRIESPPDSAPPAAPSVPRRTPLPHHRAQSPATSEVDPTHPPEPAQPPSPFAQIEILRATLRQALQQTGELLATLKRPKKQPRLVESTLASLRELQTSGV